MITGCLLRFDIISDGWDCEFDKCLKVTLRAQGMDPRGGALST